jgi:hypothetical protein
MADRLHLLRLVQLCLESGVLLLGELALGNVAQIADVEVAFRSLRPVDGKLDGQLAALRLRSVISRVMATSRSMPPSVARLSVTSSQCRLLS